MYSDSELKALMDSAEKATETINTNISIFEKTMKNVLKGVPQEQKADIERLIATTTKAISLAKKGEADKASELIKQFQSVSKDNQSKVPK